MTANNQDYQILAALLDSWHRDITRFAKEVFGDDLSPKQIEFCEKFRTHRLITHKGAVGYGKTYSMAILVWWALITHDRVQVSIFGPNEGNLKAGIWKELQQLHSRMRAGFKESFEVGAERISSVVTPASCFAERRLVHKDNISAARGIHQFNNFVFVDEASGVDDIVFTDALLNILTDPNPKLCLVSNPSQASGFFWRTWNDSEISDQWAKVHGRMADNPRLDPEAFAQQAKNYGGPTSRQYRVLVEGEFPLSDVDGLISRELIDQAVNVYDEITPPHDAPIIWGLDPAGVGKDSSVLCIRQDNKILEFKQWRGLDPTQLAYKVRDLYQATPKPQRPAVISVDSNGLGYGAWSNLKDFGLPAHACNSAKTPTRNPERYHRLRDQLWWELREWIASEEVGIPNEPKLIEELAAPTYEDGTGKIKVEDKKSLKKRLGRSPDFADALALTFGVSPTRYQSKYNWSKPIQYDNLSTFE